VVPSRFRPLAKGAITITRRVIRARFDAGVEQALEQARRRSAARRSLKTGGVFLTATGGSGAWNKVTILGFYQ